MKSSPEEREFIFGPLVYQYDLVRQDRKTLSLTVQPDLNILVKCPHEAEEDRIEQFLRRKWLWLEKQLAYFRKYQHKKYAREYVSGESYHYLGRQYKLVIEKGESNKASLTKGILRVQTTGDIRDSGKNKKLLKKWYKERAHTVLHERYQELKKDFDVQPRLELRKMRKRWGSFVSREKIILNPQLIHMPKDCIDYVIVHELCHTVYRGHGSAFYDFLEERRPDWKKTKEKLEHIGAIAVI